MATELETNSKSLALKINLQKNEMLILSRKPSCINNLTIGNKNIVNKDNFLPEN